MIGSHNPSFTDKDWNPVPSTSSPGLQFLESGIRDVESRIQDCLGFSFMGRLVSQNNETAAMLVS